VLLATAVVGAAPAAAQVGPRATSTITVDFSAVQRQIPATLFGQNLQTIERGEGVVKVDGEYDTEILELLNEAKITTLRYPGGTAADYFHWWQALGPRSARPPQSSGYLDEFYRPDVGPDEFIELSTALRAVPFLTANTGTGSADEAAALAAFFNSKGFPVVYWEVGNEIYFEGIGPNGLQGLPPDVYAGKVIDYASAIRAEAPYAKIFAAAVIGPEEDDSFWNAVVLGLAGPFVDGISVHNAYFPLYGYLPDGSIPSDHYLYNAMLASTKAVEASMAVLESQLERLGKLIPIFVTEYDGIFFPDEEYEDPEITLRRNPTLACALFNASVLHIMMRHDRVLGAHHMSLAGGKYGSLVGIDGDAHYRNPQFYVHREYAREAGNLVTRATVDSEDALFGSGPIALLSGQTGVPMLDALATRAPGGGAYTLFVVNRSLTHTVDATVELEVPTGLRGTVSVLDGPYPGSRNDADNPLRVALVTEDFDATGSFSHSFAPHSLTIFRWTREQGVRATGGRVP
jgi:alpha-L-arabinofuranosidase